MWDSVQLRFDGIHERGDNDKDVVDIRVHRRNDDNRLMMPPIIKIEFEKGTLEPHIIIGRESIQLQMKKKKPTLCERRKF